MSIPLVRARQLLDTEVGAQVLGAGTVGVCQVLCVDAEAVGGVADAVTLWIVSSILHSDTARLGTYVVADVESLRDPVVRNAAKSVRKAVDVLGGGTAVGVNVASKTGTVLRVANKEDTLDGVE